MKPFYRIKGTYADGRNKVVIEDKDNKTSISLPKPEELLDTLKNAKISLVNQDTLEAST